ncbi:hypothetical protein HDV05_004862 [Chytridiales sp. JEL 0842]|nr:hypothetical protein HDV05_004862 [Chytridiales sp. JEL 0842]
MYLLNPYRGQLLDYYDFGVISQEKLLALPGGISGSDLYLYNIQASATYHQPISHQPNLKPAFKFPTPILQISSSRLKISQQLPPIMAVRTFGKVNFLSSTNVTEAPVPDIRMKLIQTVTPPKNPTHVTFNPAIAWESAIICEDGSLYLWNLDSSQNPAERIEKIHGGHLNATPQNFIISSPVKAFHPPQRLQPIYDHPSYAYATSEAAVRPTELVRPSRGKGRADPFAYRPDELAKKRKSRRREEGNEPDEEDSSDENLEAGRNVANASEDGDVEGSESRNQPSASNDATKPSSKPIGRSADRVERDETMFTKFLKDPFSSKVKPGDNMEEAIISAAGFLGSIRGRVTGFDVYKHLTNKPFSYSDDGKPVYPSLRAPSHLSDVEQLHRLVHFCKKQDMRACHPDRYRNNEALSPLSSPTSWTYNKEEDDNSNSQENGSLAKSLIELRVSDSNLINLLPTYARDEEVIDHSLVLQALNEEFPQTYEASSKINEDDDTSTSTINDIRNNSLQMLASDLLLSSVHFERPRVEDVREKDPDRVLIHEGRFRKMAMSEYRETKRRKKERKKQAEGRGGGDASMSGHESGGTTDWETEGYTSGTSGEESTSQRALPGRRKRPRLLLPRVKLVMQPPGPPLEASEDSENEGIESTPAESSRKGVDLSPLALRLRDAWLNPQRWYSPDGVGTRIRSSEVVVASWAKSFEAQLENAAQNSGNRSDGDRSSSEGWTTADESFHDEDEDDDAQDARRKKRKQVDIDAFYRLTQERESRRLSSKLVVSSSQRESLSLSQALGYPSMSQMSTQPFPSSQESLAPPSFARVNRPRSSLPLNQEHIPPSSSSASLASRRTTIAGFGRLPSVSQASSSQTKKKKRVSGF